MLYINFSMYSGKVVRAPEFKRPKENFEVAKFTIAGKYDSSKDTLSFIDVDVLGPNVEKVRKFVQEGMAVLVTGKLKQDSWDDAKTGKKAYKIHIVANDVQPMEENQDPQAPTQQPDFMQSPQDNPPPEHTLAPKRTYQKPEIVDEGKVILRSERDFAHVQKEPPPPVTVAAGPWTPPIGGEPPF